MSQIYVNQIYFFFLILDLKVLSVTFILVTITSLGLKS